MAPEKQGNQEGRDSKQEKSEKFDTRWGETIKGDSKGSREEKDESERRESEPRARASERNQGGL